jgi:hypothetical protein
VRALELSGLASPGARAAAHRYFHRVLLCVHKEPDKILRPRLGCVVLLTYHSLGQKASCREVQSSGIYPSSGAGQKPALDTLGDDAAYVGCYFGLYEMAMEVNQEPMTPRCSGLTVVQMGSSLFAVPAEIKRGAASFFAYSDGQPVVSKFDHECSGVVRESGTG